MTAAGGLAVYAALLPVVLPAAERAHLTARSGGSGEGRTVWRTPVVRRSSGDGCYGRWLPVNTTRGRAQVRERMGSECGS